MSFEIVTVPAYRAVGLKWEGTFSEVVPYLKNMIKQMGDRAEEIQHKVNPHVLLGLSYHVVENGFAHYSVYEITEEQHIPNGMIEIRVPELTYVKTSSLNNGEEIQTTYSNLSKWLAESDYSVFKEDDVTYYDDVMPIKHEYYPANLNTNVEHFHIYIPIVKKNERDYDLFDS